MMIAEELEVDWTAIHVEQAPTTPSIYQGLRTGGSGGVASTFTAMRRVGAQAREMLIAAAAQQWQAKRRDCRAENGAVRTHSDKPPLELRRTGGGSLRTPPDQIQTKSL